MYLLVIVVVVASLILIGLQFQNIPGLCLFSNAILIQGVLCMGFFIENWNTMNKGCCFFFTKCRSLPLFKDRPKKTCWWENYEFLFKSVIDKKRVWDMLGFFVFLINNLFRLQNISNCLISYNCKAQGVFSRCFSNYRYHYKFKTEQTNSFFPAFLHSIQLFCSLNFLCLFIYFILLSELKLMPPFIH